MTFDVRDMKARKNVSGCFMEMYDSVKITINVQIYRMLIRINKKIG